jgi:predicted GNAT family acetyltransferase
VCAALASELSREEREAGGLDILSRHAWGVFCGGTLASVASYESWPSRIAHIGVVTRPTFRGRKFAQLAVRAALQGILRSRRIAQFNCPSGDASGNRVALALGFHPIVETLSLRPPSPC